MTTRPLHAVALPPGDRLTEVLAAALDGTGPAILPLDPALPRAALSALLEACRPATIETSQGTERITPPASDTQAGVPAGGDTAVVIATSGSTGRPKAAELSASALLASARASLARIGARAGERWLCPLPTFHIAGVQVLVRSIVAGTAPVVTTALTPAVLAGCGCAHASLVPTQLRRLVDAGADLSVLRTVLLGGAAADPLLVEAARAAGGRVVTTYGMSETCGGCVYDGVPLDGVQVAVGADSRIRVAGPVLFSGYRLRPELTAAARDGDWFVTADLGLLSGSGRLVVSGRADDVINTGGEKVMAGEVEAVLARCPGVREAAVVGQPDPEWGQRVTAVVVPAVAAEPPSLAEVRSHVRAALPAAAAPRRLLVVAEIPMLASGKPDREALRTLSA